MANLTLTNLAMESDSSESLTNRQIAALAASLSGEKIKHIALTYMGFTEEDIETISTESEDDEETFKRNVITRWANKNSQAQVKVRFFASCFIFVHQ